MIVVLLILIEVLIAFIFCAFWLDGNQDLNPSLKKIATWCKLQ